MSLESILEPHRRWMKLALKEAQRAFDAGASAFEESYGGKAKKEEPVPVGS